ncbi:serine protease [Bacillus seohaeanensis]|uniref:Serine protease n=1 Tax=Bacillus seohaeanensis TaxID=284580 RepID=A0ABW5RUV8_9BACI
MEIREIEEKIYQLETEIALLKKHVKETQRKCDHHFQGNLNYETCIKCNKVNVLYY